MQGSIRLIIGLVLISGSMSSIDNATSLQCLELLLLLIFGFMVFHSGLKSAIETTKNDNN